MLKIVWLNFLFSGEFEPKCGKRHQNGLNRFKVLNPRNKDLYTREGEWPHACITFKESSDDGDTFVGGASLITPGILVTNAYKIRLVCTTPNFIQLTQNLTSDKQFS